jgi:hypothetical protein
VHRQAVTRYFQLYSELHKSGDLQYERPSLLIYADLASEAMNQEEQLRLLQKIHDRLTVGALKRGRMLTRTGYGCIHPIPV